MKYLLISLLFLSAACPADSADRCFDETLCSVSIIHLVSDPELYDKKEVIVRGYFLYEEKQSYLYLDSEKAEYGLSEYSLSLTFDGVEAEDIQEHSGSYALIQGVFDQSNRGIGIFTIGSVKVTRLRLP
ncbi:hypothetical protein [Pseudidiomarina sp.]|uniref:hypothetical protein n=1 Tax=Pseudidiomarina sp. TaxID=2081707 RepID=UPI003A988560